MINDDVDIDAAFDRLRDEIVVPAMNDAAVEMVLEMKDILSVPVQYVTGPRGGLSVLRSLPGEAPRLDTTRLYESITWGETFGPGPVGIVVYTDVPYSVILENEMNRPHWSTLLENWREQLPERIDGAIHGSAGSGEMIAE